MGIKSIEIENFKSIRNSGTIELKDINVLIGANGSGKSNFIEFFNFLKNIVNEKLRLYVSKNGIDNILYFGRKKSDYLFSKIIFDVFFTNKHYKYDYIFKLIPNNIGQLIFTEEYGNYYEGEEIVSYIIDTGRQIETSLRTGLQLFEPFVRNLDFLLSLNSFIIYHFNDTSFTSNIKTASSIVDNQTFLKEDGSDIASFLYSFSKNYIKNFEILESIIKSIAPFFKRFHLVPDDLTGEILLQWVEKDTIFPVSSLSDGTLRFICLASILLCPMKPKTIILDEPELGLHPYAIEKLAAMIHIASEHSQIIISTQSIDLISQFSADDIIVVDRENEQTIFKRQSEKYLKSWLEDYSIGEIWNKNVIGGNP